MSFCLELGSPGLDLAHQMFLTSAEQRTIISLDLLAKQAVHFLCCKGTLLVCVQLTVLQGPQDVFLQSCFPSGQLPVCTGAWGHSSPAAGLGIPFVELYEFSVGPFLQPVKVLLNGSTSIWSINHSSQLCIVCKLVEGVLCLHHPGP